MQLPVLPLNGVSQYLFPYHVNKKLFRTWFPLTYFEPLTSEDMTKPVYLHVMRAGEGTQYRVGKLNPLDYKRPITDQQQRRGNAQIQSVDSCSIDTTKYSWPVLCRDLSLMQSGTPIEELPSMVTGQLTDVQHKALSDSMLNAATWGNYGTAVTAPAVNGHMPLSSRAVAGNLVTGQANDGIYTYNADAIMAVQLEAAMPTNRVAQHTLTLKHLRRLKLLAELGGVNPAAPGIPAMGFEDPIRPSRITMVNGQDSTEYYYFAHPQSITNLLNDPDFKEQMITRIHVEAQPQPISGADYIGKIYGINIYECPMLAQYQAPVTNDTCAWNLFFGAGAWTVGWYMYPQVVMDKDLIEDSILFCSHEQRGQSILEYVAKNPDAGAAAIQMNFVEQGLIHSFVKLQ